VDIPTAPAQAPQAQDNAGNASDASSIPSKTNTPSNSDTAESGWGGGDEKSDADTDESSD